jgi:outer membrane protein OmpA-like peptidoglycan-associated protein
MKHFALVSLALLSAAPAWAGQAGIDVEQFRPQLDGRGLFNAESADSHAQWDWNVGFFLKYSKNPLIVSNGSSKIADLVNDRLSGEFILAVGLLRWLEVGVALPIAFLNEQNRSLTGTSSVAGLGSMRFNLKFRILTEGIHGVGLSLLAAFQLPTGDQDAFLGQNGVAFSPTLLLEKSVSAVRFLINLGYTARNDARFFNVRVEDEIFWKLGIGWRVNDPVELGVELVGATAAASPFGGDRRQNPLELLFGGRFFVGEKWQAYAGFGPGLTAGYGTPTVRFFAGIMYGPHERDTDGDRVPDRKDRCPLLPGLPQYQGCPNEDADGDGVPNAEDECPTVPGPKENKGCPWPDTDGDGVPDKDDKCPTVPGPKENQGCPWPDTDGDGVPDKDDKCPTIPGPKENNGCPWPDADGDGVPDKDDECPHEPGPASNKGCPEKKPVFVTRVEVKVVEQINFRTGSATILKSSYGILDKVAEKLQAHPYIQSLEIQGHTDDVGGVKFNLGLSQRRAESVRKYLIGKGVAASRLVPKGYGKGKPLKEIDKKTMSKEQINEARATNRRVQFVILKEEPPASK